MVTLTSAATPLPLFNPHHHHHHHLFKSSNHSYLPLLPLPPPTHFYISRRVSPRATATPTGVFLLSEVKPPPENTTDQIVSVASDSGDGVSVVISVLLSIAFVGLSVLTIGVIYISVTDFLQKREKDKFEKEEAEKAKKGGKKKRVRPRVGPKGFGQKIDDDDDL